MRPFDGRGRLHSFVAPAVLLIAIGALLGLQLRPHQAAGPGPWPVHPSPRASTLIGATTKPLAQNSYTRWTPADLRSIDRFEQAAHTHASIVMWYADWAHVAAPSLRQLHAVAARGSVPEITWEPWDSTKGLRVPQPAYTLARITGGAYDAYVRRWARVLARYGQPVRLRFAQEMNGSWYPWAEAANGNRPGQFVAAWRHVWEIFRQEGATNVRWVWSPVATHVKAEEYPGNAYVDIIGLSGFVGGSQLRYNPWKSFQQAFGRALAEVHALAPRKPVEISEVGVGKRGGDKAAWITGMFHRLARLPQVKALVWFDLDKKSDWRIQSSPAAARAFAAGVSASRYGQRHLRFRGGR